MPPKKQRKTAPRRVRTITEEELPAEIDQMPDDELLELETFFNEIGTGDDVRYKLYVFKRVEDEPGLKTEPRTPSLKHLSKKPTGREII
jgi:hypothetical protein